MSERPAPFDDEALIARARYKAGLDDFGDEGFRVPLGVLTRSLSCAPLNAVGTMVLRSSIVRSLVQRLSAQDWIRRHPEIEEEPIEAPWVVVGMMRSGTTLLQRLLARDPRHYCAFGWEIGEPAPRPGTRFDAPDPRIPDAEARSQQMREFAPELSAIHPTDALEPDEEIVFLADAFLSHVPEASCDVPEYRSWLDGQDFTPAYRYLRRMLQLLQWQKRRRGEQCIRWVLKTPGHLGYLDTLLETFPNARVIHMHRSPVETIASGASLNHTLWRMYADDVDPREVGRQWLERMTWATGRGMAARRAMADEDERFTDVWYRDAVANPLEAAAAVYRQAGVALSPEARDAMGAWLARDAHAGLARHRYALEDFGLDEAQVRDAFADYSERFVDPFLRR